MLSTCEATHKPYARASGSGKAPILAPMRRRAEAWVLVLGILAFVGGLSEGEAERLVASLDAGG